MGLGRFLTLAFSTPLTSLSPQLPPSPPPPSIGKPTPRDFLSGKPPGPYTCLRARGMSVLGIDFHLQRLRESIGACGHRVDEGTLRSLVLDGIEHSLLTAIKEDDGLHGDPEKLDTFVTVHATLPSEQGSGAVDLSFHSIPMPFAVIPPPVTLEVCGGPRNNAPVKHSQWLWDRQELELHRHGPGGEVVLFRTDPNGRVELLEGLVTNLMVVKDGTLYTAPEGCVLKGHVRGLAIAAAETLKVPCVEKAPYLDEVDSWDEAFITGSGRLMVPVNRVQSEVMGLGPVALPQAPGPITNLLRQRVLYDIDKSWEAIDALKATAKAAAKAAR